MKLEFEIYEPLVTCYDKDNKHTACKGERCKLDGVYILDGKQFVTVINSQANNLDLPLDFFEKVFKVSKNQIAPL